MLITPAKTLSYYVQTSEMLRRKISEQPFLCVCVCMCMCVRVRVYTMYFMLPNGNDPIGSLSYSPPPPKSSCEWQHPA